MILEKRGYMVQEINLTDCTASPYGYNPLDYIRVNCDHRCHDQDVMTVAAALVPAGSLCEPYWELAARSMPACKG